MREQMGKDHSGETSLEIFSSVIDQKKPVRTPCGLHWWGIYKYEALGLDYKRDAWKNGKELSGVYSRFYEMFKPDWFHLHIGTPGYFKDSEISEKNGSAVLTIDPKYRGEKKDDRYFSVDSSEDEDILDFPDYLLGSRAKKPKVDLRHRHMIDEYVKRYVFMSAEQITGLGYTDHVKIIAEEYGKTVFIAVHIPSAVAEIFDPTTGYVGFNEGLMALLDCPQGMMYLIEKCYEAQLEWARAYAGAGARAYVISETYVSPDITGENVYRDFLKPVHIDYFKEVENLGMYPICNFWGDVNPLIEDLKEINIKALMVEEGKKTFDLDAAEIREKMNGVMCVFGNIDSIGLLRTGTPGEVVREVLRQAEGDSGNFVVANGSPVAPGTPVRNVRSMIKTVREEL